MPLKHEGVHDSLLRVVASQADALALTGSDGDVEGGCWTPRGFLKRNTQLTTLSRELSLDELRAHFGKPIVEVAKEFGICTTFLKKICRRCGIKRWPHRQIRSLQRTIQMLHQAESNASTPQERLKFSNQIAQLEAKKRAVIQDPDANGKLKRVKKCGAKNKGRRSASEKSEDDVDMDASDDDDMDDEDDARRLLEMAGAHLPAATAEAAPKLAVSESPAVTAIGDHPFDAPLDPVLVADTPTATAASPDSPSPPKSPSSTSTTPSEAVAKTPTASSKLSKCSSPDETSSEPAGLKISPSNRKISLGTKKYDATDSQRVRSTSLGSLQDEGEQVEEDPVATEVST